MTLNFLKKLFSKNPSNFTGALLVEQSPEIAEKDIQFHEIVASANAVNWVEKKIGTSDWRIFPEFDQKQSMMCGAFSMKKLLGIFWFLKYGTFIEFSEEHIYQRRRNKNLPAGYKEGMGVDDLYSIIQESVTLKVLTGAKIQTDADADNCVIEQFKHDIGKQLRLGQKIVVTNDIETIASIIQSTGKALHVFTYFKADEWSALYPQRLHKLFVAENAALRHFVIVSDFGLVNGVKKLQVEDSAHFGGLAKRYVDEDWVKNRFYVVTYPMNFAFEKSTDPNRPHYTFKNELSYSSIVIYGNPDVVALQNILKYEGVLPTNVGSTGYFGSLTKQAVAAFQKAHSLPQTGAVDIATMQLLNSLYN